jgi:putative transposase
MANNQTGPSADRLTHPFLEAAQKSWRRLHGHNQLPKLVLGVTFNDGIEVIAKPTDRQSITAAA